MGHWVEIWSRPGDSSFGRVIDGLPTSEMTLHGSLNGLGDGSCRVASSFDRFDEILLLDGASSVRSLARVFSEEDPTTPAFEWLPSALVPTSNTSDFLVEVSGRGINSITEDAVTQAFDWDGSDDYAPAQPDWEWGAANLLSNGSFGENTVTPKSWELIITATGGTYTISDGTDTTSAIAFNASASTVETRIQTDIAAISDIVVAQAGPGTLVLQLVTPAFGINLSVNTGSLTGGTATITTTQEGGRTPSPWTRAAALANGVPKDIGTYDQFRVTSTGPAHSGVLALEIDPGAVGATTNRLAGAQQVVGVDPGATYQASVWIYPTSATDRYRLSLWSIGEELVAFDSANGSAYPANTWTQLSLTDVLMPDNVDSVIFRIQNTNQYPSNPLVFYVDDAEMYGGLVPTTPGGIISDLYDTYVDSALRSPIVWDDGSATDTPYLTLDFTASVDSGGNAWFEQEISFKVWQRQTLHDVLNNLANTYDIEWRVVADDVENGTWLLQVYNPGGMQTDYTTSASPAIQGGSADVQRQIRRILPIGTEWTVEGLARITARDRDSDLVSALGRIEAAVIDREAPSLDALAEAAYIRAVNTERNGKIYSYVLVNPQDEPLSDYVIGDALTIHDPPEVDDDARLVDVTGIFSSDRVEWNVIFEPRTASGS